MAENANKPAPACTLQCVWGGGGEGHALKINFISSLHIYADIYTCTDSYKLPYTAAIKQHINNQRK